MLLYLTKKKGKKLNISKIRFPYVCGRHGQFSHFFKQCAKVIFIYVFMDF
jgi:hypothetical protein